MKPRHIIIGAGISGLALGWFLKKRFGNDQELIILESSERVGGWIQTVSSEGFLFEKGPRSCRTKGNGLATLQLVEALGIEKEVIPASPQAKKRFIYWKNQLQPLPNSLFSFFRSPLMKGILSASWKEFRVAPSTLEDESIADFISRRFNPQIAERLIDPLVTGIYAGDIKQLSIRSCFSTLHDLEQEYGSVIKGMLWKKKAKKEMSPFVQKISKMGIFSFKKGMETLIHAIENQLDEHIKLSSSVKSIRQNEGTLCVTLENGEELTADRIFCAVPGFVASKILREMAPLTANEMQRNPAASVAVVNLGWNHKVLKQEGFGYLVPSSQKQKILGIVFDSCAFPQQNGHQLQTRLTVMMGGMHHPGMIEKSDEELKTIIQEVLNQHLEITSAPEVFYLSRAKQAIPQYQVGHETHLKRIEHQLKKMTQSRLFLLGCAWRGVAVNDCVAEAKKIVDSLSLLLNLETAVEEDKLTQSFES